MTGYYNFLTSITLFAHFAEFCMSIATVIGPTPPGTGVTKPATNLTLK